MSDLSYHIFVGTDSRWRYPGWPTRFDFKVFISSLCLTKNTLHCNMGDLSSELFSLKPVWWLVSEPQITFHAGEAYLLVGICPLPPDPFFLLPFSKLKGSYYYYYYKKKQVLWFATGYTKKWERFGAGHCIMCLYSCLKFFIFTIECFVHRLIWELLKIILGTILWMPPTHHLPILWDFAFFNNRVMFKFVYAALSLISYLKYLQNGNALSCIMYTNL